MNKVKPMPYFGALISDTSARETEIRQILASGKAVRFFDGNVWKDVKEFAPDENGDLKAFRKSENAKSPYVLWESSCYSIEAVDI